MPKNTAKWDIQSLFSKKPPAVQRIFCGGVWPVATLTGVILSGCAGFSVNGIEGEATRPSGEHAVINRIKTGQTKDFILGLLGEPDERTPEGDGIEVWKWHYTDSRTTFSGFVFLYGSLTETKLKKTRCVDFKDGIVVRTWSY